MTAGYYMDFAREIDKLSPENVHAAFQELQKEQKLQVPFTRFVTLLWDKRTAGALRRLFMHMQTLGGGLLPRTAAANKAARREVNALYVKLGLPDLFVR